MTSGSDLTVLFDADCGLCAHSALVLSRLDQAHHLRFVPLQAAQTTYPAAPPEAQLAATLHVVDEAGDWVQGGAACLLIASVVPLLRPLAVVGRIPLASSLVERAYRLIARNRHRLSRLLGLETCSYRGSGGLPPTERQTTGGLQHPPAA